MQRPQGPTLETAGSLSAPLHCTCPQGLQLRGPPHPLPPAPHPTGTHDHTPQTVRPRQPEPSSTLCPKLGGVPPAAHSPLSPAGVWRDRHVPGWTDSLCGLACPPTFFSQVGYRPPKCPSPCLSPLLRWPLCSPALASVWESLRGPGILAGPLDHLPSMGCWGCGGAVGREPTPTLSARPTWAPAPRLKAGPGFCSFGFSRTLLFPGKPGNHSSRFSLCLPLFHPGSRVLSGLGPAGEHLAQPTGAHFWVMTPALARSSSWASRPWAPRGCHLVATSGVTGFPRLRRPAHPHPAPSPSH